MQHVAMHAASCVFVYFRGKPTSAERKVCTRICDSALQYNLQHDTKRYNWGNNPQCSMHVDLCMCCDPQPFQLKLAAEFCSFSAAMTETAKSVASECCDQHESYCAKRH